MYKRRQSFLKATFCTNFEREHSLKKRYFSVKTSKKSREITRGPGCYNFDGSADICFQNMVICCVIADPGKN